jgi:hypothetical protein
MPDPSASFNAGRVKAGATEVMLSRNRRLIDPSASLPLGWTAEAAVPHDLEMIQLRWHSEMNKLRVINTGSGTESLPLRHSFDV